MLSGLEKEELMTRMHGTTRKEQQMIAEALPEAVLWEELTRRAMIKDAKIKKIEELFKENSPADYQSEQD